MRDEWEDKSGCAEEHFTVTAAIASTARCRASGHTNCSSGGGLELTGNLGNEAMQVILTPKFIRSIGAQEIIPFTLIFFHTNAIQRTMLASNVEDDYVDIPDLIPIDEGEEVSAAALAQVRSRFTWPSGLFADRDKGTMPRRVRLTDLLPL
jgi:hypothetical protein